MLEHVDAEKDGAVPQDRGAETGSLRCAERGANVWGRVRHLMEPSSVGIAGNCGRLRHMREGRAGLL
jgi:hypothetical protein